LLTLLSFVAANRILLIVLALFLSVLAFYRLIGIGRIAAAATRRPRTAIACCLLLVACLGLGVGRLRVDANLNSILPATMASRQTDLRIEKAFGSVDRVYIVVEAKRGDAWSPGVLAAVKSMCDELAAAPYVDKVISLSEGKDARLEDDSLTIGKMMDGLPADEAGIAALRSRLRAHPLLGRRLVSADDKAALIAVLLKPSLSELSGEASVERKVTDAEVCAPDPASPGRPSLGNLKARYESDDIAVSFSGLPYIRYESAKKMMADMSLFLPAGIAIMLGFLFLCFRSLRGMLLPFTVVASSLLGLYGFIGLLGEKIYLPYVIIGPMFIAIAHNYGTQLVASYYEEIRARPGSADLASAARDSVVKMGSPLLLSAATVIVGFLTMLGHPLPPMAYLGFFSAFGITLAFALTIVLTPAILSLLGPPRRALSGGQDAAVDRALAAAARFVVRRRYAILAFAAALVAACALLIPRVRTDSNAVGYYRKDSAVYKAFEMIGEKFGGASTIDVLLEARSPAAADSPDDGPLKSAAAMKWMERLQAYAESLTDPETGKALVGDSSSIADQVAYLNGAMQGDAAQDRVPDDDGLIAQYLMLADQADLSSLVDSKFNAAQVVIQMPDMGTGSVRTVVEGLKSFVGRDPPPGLDVSFGGAVMGIYELNGLLVEGQIKTILLSVAVIVLCYMLVFRSVSAGILASIPLVIAIALVFGMMALFRINLDNITSILTGIMIGAGTDYTAYFLWRMRELAPSSASLEEAYVGTMETIGKGIVYNGFSVVIGFVVFFWSNFLPVVFFGALISVSILVCILGALTVLPVALLIAKPKFLTRRAS